MLFTLLQPTDTGLWSGTDTGTAVNFEGASAAAELNKAPS